MSLPICKALKIRIYPNLQQETLILKTLGSCRFIYNQMLAERITTYEKLKADRQALNQHKYKTEKEYKATFDWLREVDSIALQQSHNDLLAAYQNFFRSCRGKRKGEVGFPTFHKKGHKESYRTVATKGNIALDFATRKVKLPKLGWIRWRDRRRSVEGELKQATVSRTATGKYFVSILFKREIPLEEKTTSNPKTKGLCCSFSRFYVDDEGYSPSYHATYQKEEKKLGRSQRRLSRKQKGSHNRSKARLKVAKVHERIANKRRDFTHKLSSKLVAENDVLVVENLSLKALAQGLNLGKVVNDLGYGMFLQQLEYKALWKNKKLIKTDKLFSCSQCEGVHQALAHFEPVFSCPSCGFKIDRDHNAAIALKNYALKELGLRRPDIKPVECETSTHDDNSGHVCTAKQEAPKLKASE